MRYYKLPDNLYDNLIRQQVGAHRHDVEPVPNYLNNRYSIICIGTRGQQIVLIFPNWIYFWLLKT